MEKIDKDLAEEPADLPDGRRPAKVQVFTKLRPAEETKYTKAFQNVLGA